MSLDAASGAAGWQDCIIKPTLHLFTSCVCEPPRKFGRSYWLSIQYLTMMSSTEGGIYGQYDTT